MNSDNYLALLRFVSRLLPLALICVASLGMAARANGTTPGGKGEADLTVAKSGDEAVPRGGQITYSIVVTNGGPDTAGNVVVTDPIPANTTFVNASVSTGSFNVASGVVTANFGNLALLDSATLTLVVSVNGNTPRDAFISNTATASSDTPDPAPSDNSSTAVTAVIGPLAGDLLISEFRLRGPGAVGDRIKGLDSSASDEFIEIYNNTGVDHLVTAASGTGYGIVASDGVLRCTIPNGTTIPKNGHFLCVNSNGYSLAGYPAGNFTTATGDASYSTEIPDNAGIALFNNNNGDYTTDTRLDAVGSTSETNALYREGSGYPALGPIPLGKQVSIDYSFYRDNCGQQGAISSQQPCSITTGVIDTNNNATDFIFVDTNATPTSAGQRLGAPGPENLSSPIENNSAYTISLLDPCVGGNASPNQVRDPTPDPQNNSTLGTIELRRTITNNSISAATRLRFRVTQQATLPAPAGTADLRLRTSTDVVTTVNQQPCGSGTSAVTAFGTALEQPPFQINGGAFNSTVSASAVGPGIIKEGKGLDGATHKGPVGNPLNPESSIGLRFLWGVQQSGKFRVTLNIEVVEPPSSPEEKPGDAVSGKKTKER